MLFRRFYDENLAQASFLIACESTREGVIIDPTIDIAFYTRAAGADRVRIAHVTETHVHADFVSGARALAEATGAALHLSGEGKSEWAYSEDALARANVLRHGTTFGVGDVRLEAIHTPGHTPGSCCLLRESNRLLLTGDTILKNITPNPVLNPDPIDPERRFPSLGEYLVSLARIRSLAPTLLRTAHGDDVNDYEEHFHRLLRHIRDRQTKVIGLVPKDGTTVWKISGLVFPSVSDIHRFLAVSEAAAHLDLAVAEGRLRVELNDGVERFLRA